MRRKDEHDRRGSSARRSAKPHRERGEGECNVYLPGRKALLELEAKRPQALVRVLVRDGVKPTPELEGALERIRGRGLPIKLVAESELDALSSGVHHQGVLAEIHPLTPCSLDELLAKSKRQTGLLVALDEVNDPHNVGAILRVSDATGVDGLILPRAHSSPLTAAARRVSVGASEFVPTSVVPNLARALEQCRKAGYWLIGTALGAESRPLFETEIPLPAVVVIGSEGSGLRKLTRESCDTLVHLPMAGQLQSVNASQAASAVLYELLRRRLTGSPC